VTREFAIEKFPKSSIHRIWKGRTDVKKKNGKLGLHVLAVTAVLLTGLFACIAFGPLATLAQTSPGIITIDVPGAVGGTVATAINAAGVIAGLYFASDGIHGFVRNPDDTFVSFDSPLGPGYIYPTSINNAGVITGFYLDGNFGAFGGSHGFVRTPDGTLTSFDAPIDPANPMPGTLPYSINSRGQVAGTYSVNCSDAQLAISPPIFPPCNNGFLRQPDGTITTFYAPNFQGGMLAASMNERGAIAGYSHDGQSQRGFLRMPDGTFTSIDPPDPGATWVAGINSRGEVAGAFSSSGLPNFLRTSGGSFTLFNPPLACPGDFHLAYALSESGTVAGVYNDCFHSYSYTFVFLRFADGTFTSFFPGFTSGYSLVAGINSSNAVVGTYRDAYYRPHGYLWPGNAGN
jgi:hypothetical protein